METTFRITSREKVTVLPNSFLVEANGTNKEYAFASIEKVRLQKKDDRVEVWGWILWAVFNLFWYTDPVSTENYHQLNVFLRSGKIEIHYLKGRLNYLMIEKALKEVNAKVKNLTEL